jgi:hypothetical protein
MVDTMTPTAAPEKLRVCDRLHRTEALLLAHYFGMSPRLRDALTPGLEPHEVWEYVARVERLAELPAALRHIERGDLVVLLIGPTTGEIQVLESAGTILIRSGEAWLHMPDELGTITPAPLPKSMKQRWEQSKPWKVIHSVAEKIYREYRGVYEDLIGCEHGQSDATRMAIAAHLEHRVFPRVDVQILRLDHVICAPLRETDSVRALLALASFHPALLAATREYRVNTIAFSRLIILSKRMRVLSFQVLSHADSMLSHYLEVA